ncbi:unnamed protein product [Sphenostylis stenocarpa]|uniref:Uncharacterized protein n=1 Tax=Sphenostylis stenocarpa TaxID=92480 RepID=A0AA86VGG8_9FABA|nr:unnamed protein product [Sphenostylis stenocarpa]
MEFERGLLPKANFTSPTMPRLNLLYTRDPYLFFTSILTKRNVLMKMYDKDEKETTLDLLHDQGRSK